MVDSTIHSDEKLYVLKTFGDLYVFNFMEICTYQTSAKGKGSCYGKREEWWYHCMKQSVRSVILLNILKDPKKISHIFSTVWISIFE